MTATTYPEASAAATGGIDATRARTVATRLRALEAAGYPLSGGQRWVLQCCERRVRAADALASPTKETPQ